MGRRGGRAARRRAGLLLQRRDQGAHSARRSPRRCPTWPTSRAAPGPAPRAAPACRCLTAARRQGVAVSKALCEHFSQSRAELFEIVQASGIPTFTELIERHGTGRGCDICKPAVASILAVDRRRAHPRRRAGGAAGHQRPLPRQHPAQRHLLRRAAHPRRRDHPGEAHRDRRGGPRLRPRTPRSPAGSGSTCSAPASSSCRRSGRGSSTPASSPGTPTARRCGR